MENEFYRKKLYTEKTDSIVLQIHRKQLMGEEKDIDALSLLLVEIVADIELQYPKDEIIKNGENEMPKV
jgi:hypothetical protein